MTAVASAAHCGELIHTVDQLKKTPTDGVFDRRKVAIENVENHMEKRQKQGVKKAKDHSKSESKRCEPERRMTVPVQSKNRVASTPMESEEQSREPG